MGAQGSNLPPNFPKMEDYQRQNNPKSAKVARKLRSMAKIARCTKMRKLRKSCTPQHRNFLVGLNKAGLVVHPYIPAQTVFFHFI